ncbi:MAG TPA: GAF domain-containing protein [Nocardioidaceae bacterium]|nr:GAF domain-containing protein [Nocardioidaceae bacterium]
MDAEKLARTFADLADTLVDDFDVIELLHVLASRCVDLLGVTAAGLLVVDDHDRLQVAVSSSENARLLELFQLQNDEGPCLEGCQTGRPVAVERLDQAQRRWPRFAPAALELRFGSVLALPMRLQGQVIGA